MYKIALIADLHANLPALTAVLESTADCDRIYHLGDAIAIGAYPAECLELLLANPKVTMILGNHEEYFIKGVDPKPDCMSGGEVVHQKWTHSRLNEVQKNRLSSFPYKLTEKFHNTTITFCHSPFMESEPFKKYQDLRRKSVEELDLLCGEEKADIVAYGHTHLTCNLKGKRHYLNPGSVGCHKETVAKYMTIKIDVDSYQVKEEQVPYDKAQLLREMESRDVPEREFICRAFF